MRQSSRSRRSTNKLKESQRESPDDPQVNSQGVFKEINKAPVVRKVKKRQIKSVIEPAKPAPEVRRTFVEDPLAKRFRVIERHLKEFKYTLDKIRKLDTKGLLQGEGFGFPPTHLGMWNFSDLYDCLAAKKYETQSVSEEEWLQSRAAFSLMKGKNTADLDSITSRYKREDFIMIEWDSLESDVKKILTSVFRCEKESDADDSCWMAAKTIERQYEGIIQSAKQKQTEDLQTLTKEEIKERLGVENREPAMVHWRKKPYERRSYNVLEEYVPVIGLAEEERRNMVDMLDADGPNRWLQNDYFLKHQKATDIDKQPTKKSCPDRDGCSWATKILGTDMLSCETWGIDPYTRRNILLCLESLEPEHLRMDQPQIQWFIEGILLRAINSVDPNLSHDLCHSLNKIKQMIHRGWASEEISRKLKESVDEIKRSSSPNQVESSEQENTLLKPDTNHDAENKLDVNAATVDIENPIPESLDPRMETAQNHITPSNPTPNSLNDHENADEGEKRTPKVADEEELPISKVNPVKKKGKRKRNMLSMDVNPDFYAVSSQRKRKSPDLYEAVAKATVIKEEPVKLESPKKLNSRSASRKLKASKPRKRSASALSNRRGIASEEAALVGQRVSIFWPLDYQWFAGRIIEYDDSCKDDKELGKNLLVHYDDDYEEWVDIRKERYVLEDSSVTIYDRHISKEALLAAVDTLIDAVFNWGEQSFCVHPKGAGIVCNTDITCGDLVGPYLGELYPLWLWEQKEAREDAERKTVSNGVTLPDFWNMRLELPGDTEGGFYMMYVDAKYHGTFASRFSHSCRPNCGAMLAVVDGKYQICVRALRNIEPGEEITIDYNCVTDSIDEFRAAICLCGYEGCRGSFLYFSGAAQYMQVVDRRHRTVHRVAMLFESSFEINKSSSQLYEYQGQLDVLDKIRLEKFGLKSHALDALPVWLLRYSALALKFVELEELELPARLFVEEMTRRRTAAMVSNDEDIFKKPKDPLAIQIMEDLWQNMKREARAVAQQRASNLVTALNKAHHRMDARIRLGHLDEIIPPAPSVSVGSPRGQTSEFHEAKLRHLVADSNAKLVERVWWVGDRAEARWCGDDAAQYPGWYPGTIVHVYHEGLQKIAGRSKGRANIETGPSVHFQYDEGELDRIPLNPAFLKRTRIAASERTKNIFSKQVTIETSDETTQEDAKMDPPLVIAVRDVVKVEANPDDVTIETNDVKIEIQIGDEAKMKPCDESGFPAPFTSMSVFHHQTPLRALSDTEIVDALWNDRTNSVAQRLLTLLQEHVPIKHSMWQCTLDPHFFKPYWWHLETREIRKSKPSYEELNKTIEIIPDPLRRIEELVTNFQVSNPREARNGLEQIRENLLKMPLPDARLEEVLQKAADLLTMYSQTKNWFIVREPPPIQKSINPWRASLMQAHNVLAACYNTRNSFLTEELALHDDGETHESSVVAPLLGWLDQKEQNMEIAHLVGSVVLPNVESAFEIDKSDSYLNSHRSGLLKQMHHREHRYSEWTPEVRTCFPDCPPKLPPASVTAWPPPVPPMQLCGSPILDASILDNREFERLTRGLAGDLDDVFAKKALQELEKPASVRGNSIFERLNGILRDTLRTKSMWSREDERRWEPPAAPMRLQITWVQCDSCHKWRKLLPGHVASDFPDPFFCSHLIEVDPHFATCSIAEESSTGETVMRWGYGINGVDDLKVGHRVDAYAEKRWAAAEVADVKPDAVLVQFSKKLGIKEKWIQRHPQPGKQPHLSPLYSWTSKSDDEFKPHKFVQVTKWEKSRFGPKLTAKDYAKYISGVSVAISGGVRSVMANLVNEVSAALGEPLGKVCVTLLKKVNISQSNRNPNYSAGAALAQSKAVFLFFEAMKRALGSYVSYCYINELQETLSTEQMALWNPSLWTNTRYAEWTKKMYKLFKEEDEERVLRGMQVKTPDGIGIVLKRSCGRKYLVAVRAQPNLQLLTLYGPGVVVDTNEEGRSLIKLDWGAWLFQHDVAVVREYFLAVPVYPWLELRFESKPLADLHRLKDENTFMKSSVPEVSPVNQMDAHNNHTLDINTSTTINSSMVVPQAEMFSPATVDELNSSSMVLPKAEMCVSENTPNSSSMVLPEERAATS